jgi:hypothetical protein
MPACADALMQVQHTLEEACRAYATQVAQVHHGHTRIQYNRGRSCLLMPTSVLMPTDDVIVYVGAVELVVSGTLACLSIALRSLRYMGAVDYYSNVPAMSPADVFGCPEVGNKTPVKDFINLTTIDNQPSGERCNPTHGLRALNAKHVCLLHVCLCMSARCVRQAAS